MHLQEFLPRAEHETLLAWVLENQDGYIPAGMDYGDISPNFRVSLKRPKLGPCKEILRARCQPMLADLAAALGMKGLSFGRLEMELVAHNEGAFFKPHIDTGHLGGDASHRLISAVYYFHRQPKGFSGGALRLFDLSTPGAFIDYEPADKSLLIFPAFAPHEVRRVTCESRAFEDSRFAINMWAHRSAI